MSDDPLVLFDAWFAEARTSEINDPNAVTLASVGADGQPSARMVLLKGHGPDGFVFYTNQQSHKANQMFANPQVALLFHWKSLRRQVRIEGIASPVEDVVADAYFATRGRDSQIGAWASRQSQPLDSRATFETAFAQTEARFAGQDVPRPPHWSGFLVTPRRIEFWQDRAHRLHERHIFLRSGASSDRSPQEWSHMMLYP